MVRSLLCGILKMGVGAIASLGVYVAIALNFYVWTNSGSLMRRKSLIGSIVSIAKVLPRLSVKSIRNVL